jgi:hypothetical protein
MEPKLPNPFMPSAILVAVIFAFASTVVNLIATYNIIGSEPSGSLISPIYFVTGIVCLVAIFAGLFAVKHHVNMYNEPLQMGRGAVIGLTTGALVAVFMAIFSLMWYLVDPGFNTKVMNAVIAQMEAIQQIPAAQKQEIIDGIYTQFQKADTTMGRITSTLWNVFIFGGLNAITGILGVKFFAPKDNSNEL